MGAMGRAEERQESFWEDIFEPDEYEEGSLNPAFKGKPIRRYRNKSPKKGIPPPRAISRYEPMNGRDPVTGRALKKDGTTRAQRRPTVKKNNLIL